MKLSLDDLNTKEKILPGVQYLRGICAFGVVLCHYSNESFGPDWQKVVSSIAFTGVYIFFFVSGFINVYAMLLRKYRVKQFFTFVLKRLIRFDPPYYVVILLTLLLFNLLQLLPSFKGQSLPVIPGQLLGNLFYFAPLTPYPFYSSVFWSLCVEFQFYLILGLIYFLSYHKVFRMAFLLSFAALSYCSGLHGFYSVFSYAPLFSFGISLVPFYLKKNPSDLILSLFFLVVITDQFGWPTGLILVAAAIITLFYRRKIAVLFFLGDISYSLYLSHGLTFVVLTGVLKHIYPPFLAHSMIALFLQLTISIVIAYLLYRFVEKPAAQLSKRILYNCPPGAVLAKKAEL